MPFKLNSIAGAGVEGLGELLGKFALQPRSWASASNSTMIFLPREELLTIERD